MTPLYICTLIKDHMIFFVLKSDPFIHLYFNKIMIELINSRNVPDLFKDHFVYSINYTSYIVSVHILCQASIYTLSLCRGHSWRGRQAKQETLTPPGHLISPLVCRGPWMSTVVLYCWCHSDSASVLLYFTLFSYFIAFDCIILH